MIIQLGENSYDITLICTSVVGVNLLMTYVGLAYVVTHNGDFYQVRRWKVALWLASIFGVISSALFIFFSVTAVVSSAVEKNAYEIIGQIIGVIFFPALLSSFRFFS